MTMLSQIVLAGTWFLATRQLVAAGCDTSGNYTIIASPDDVDSVNSCSAINGSLSLLFGNDASSWDSDEASVDLGDLTTVENDLVIYPSSHSKKTVVTAPSLQTVDGELTISNIETSTVVDQLSISFPELETVGSDYVITGGFAEISLEHKEGLNAKGLMRIYSVDVTEISMGGLYQVDGDFSIDTNDDLEEVQMGSLTITQKDFSIQDNSALTNMSFPDLKSVKGDMTIYKNPKLTVVDLPALEFAQTISITSNGGSPTFSFPYLASLGNYNTTSTSTFEDASEIQFFSLRNVTGSLTFQSLTLEDLTIPLILSLNGSITVQDNPSMTTLALPRVSTIGDIFISDNDKLTNFTANALKTAGTISLTGSFTDVEFFGLEEVTGDFKVVGDDSMDCSWFDDNVKKIVKGSYNCVGNHDQKDRKPSTGGIQYTLGDPQQYISAGGDGDSSNSGSSNGSSSGGSDSSDSNSSGKKSGKGLSTGAQAGIGVGVAFAGLLIVAAVLFFFWRRRKQNAAGQHRDQEKHDESRESVYDGQMLGVHTKIEANSVTNSAPSLGTLDFSRNSFLEGSAAGSALDKEMGPWKTIRRVSDSTGGATSRGSDKSKI